MGWFDRIFGSKKIDDVASDSLSTTEQAVVQASEKEEHHLISAAKTLQAEYIALLKFAEQSQGTRKQDDPTIRRLKWMRESSHIKEERKRPAHLYVFTSHEKAQYFQGVVSNYRNEDFADFAAQVTRFCDQEEVRIQRELEDSSGKKRELLDKIHANVSALRKDVGKTMPGALGTLQNSPIAQLQYFEFTDLVRRWGYGRFTFRGNKVFMFAEHPVQGIVSRENSQSVFIHQSNIMSRFVFECLFFIRIVEHILKLEEELRNLD